MSHGVRHGKVFFLIFSTFTGSMTVREEVLGYRWSTGSCPTSQSEA